ncbi:hypothetical protein BaRGS_00022961 [Batillaria attramentaria]|uniref:Uncharacterized protein n=1 Tax=Batillaria attramentaria TaxID=370345 RepID=A0ABD0KFL3_9CAEN
MRQSWQTRHRRDEHFPDGIFHQSLVHRPPQRSANAELKRGSLPNVPFGFSVGTAKKHLKKCSRKTHKKKTKKQCLPHHRNGTRSLRFTPSPMCWHHTTAEHLVAISE